MRQSTKLGAAVLASAALVAAGCGSSNDNKSSGSGAAATTPAPASGGKTASATGPVAISMKGIQFDPKDQTVKVGQKITWTNDDAVNHNVTANSGADFKSSDFGQGKTYEFTPTKAGTIKYTCTLHPGMDGTLTVK